jgi:hypothetical protein
VVGDQALKEIFPSDYVFLVVVKYGADLSDLWSDIMAEIGVGRQPDGVRDALVAVGCDWRPYAHAVVERVADPASQEPARIRDDGRERGRSLELERERDAAERMRHLAESHQTRFQHKLAALQLQDNRFSDAERELWHIPPSIASYDTRRLAFETHAVPRSVAVLADGHWGIVCAALHPDGRRLIVSDAGGALVLWDLESAQVIKRLAEPRWLPPDENRLRAGRPNH